MSDNEWGNIDFGFDNDDTDDYRAFVRTTINAPNRAISQHSFNAVDGVWTQDLGKRGRQITWRLQVLVDSYATLADYEAELEQNIGKVYDMVCRTETFQNVELMSYRPTSDLRGCQGPFNGYQEYELEFMQHTP